MVPHLPLADDEAAVLLGYAQGLVQRGSPDRALEYLERAHGLLQGPRHEREAAIALGNITRIRVSKGEVDEALALHHERLLVFDKLGDKDGRAHTLWSIGTMAFARGEGQAAYDALSECYSLNLALGRLEGIIYVGLDLGRLLAMAGHIQEAIEILGRSRAGLVKLGRMDDTAGVEAMLEQVRALRP